MVFMLFKQTRFILIFVFLLISCGKNVGTDFVSQGLNTNEGLMTMPLESISITPTSASIANGTNQQFIAMGRYLNGDTLNITDNVNWVSETSSVARFANASIPGSVTGYSTGISNITATLNGITSNTAVLTVTSATLVSISISANATSMPKGATHAFTATGTFSDGTTQDITTSTSWHSTNSSAVQFLSSPGLATGSGMGVSVITASLGGVTSTNSHTLTVTAAVITSIAVTPANQTISVPQTQQYVATATYSDATTGVITTTAAWSSSDQAKATINATTGLATSVAAGSTTISASSGGITGSTTLTVNVAPLVSIAVTPANPSNALGTQRQFTATGTYADASTQDITGLVTWASSDTGKATISAAGLATTLALGSSTISATLGAINGTTTLTVTAATLVSIAVTPSNPTIAKGLTQQFTATGTYTDGTTADLTATATWTSSDLTKVAINASGTNGLARAENIGSATITATLGAISGTTTLTVGAATLSSIAVTPATPTINNGATQQFVATGTYSDATTGVITGTVTWTRALVAGGASVSTISAGGLLTAAAAGTKEDVTVTATLGAISGSKTFYLGYFAYVSDWGGTASMRRCPFYKNGSIGACTNLSATFGALSPRQSLISGNTLYAATSTATGYVRMCTIGTDGALSACSSLTLGAWGHSLAIYGGKMYTSTWEPAQIPPRVSYILNFTSGSLPTGPAASGATFFPGYIVIYANYLFSTPNTNFLYKCTINGDGTLSGCVTESVGTLSGPSGLVIHGGYIYIANNTGGAGVKGNIIYCPISAAGAITTASCAQATSTFATAGQSVHGMIIDGNYMYMNLDGTGQIHRCTINSNGTLSNCADTGATGLTTPGYFSVY